MKEIIVQHVRYNFWANERLVSLFNTVLTDYLDKEVSSSFQSIRKTFLHVWDAEHIWQCRLNNQSFGLLPGKMENPDLSGLLKCSSDWIDYVEKQDETFFLLSTKYQNMKGDWFANKNSGIIMHCMNHSTFHRGQIIAIARQLGYQGPVPSTDLITYLREID